jgi:hypothetical protein
VSHQLKASDFVEHRGKRGASGLVLGDLRSKLGGHKSFVKLAMDLWVAGAVLGKDVVDGG